MKKGNLTNKYLAIFFFLFVFSACSISNPKNLTTTNYELVNLSIQNNSGYTKEIIIVQGNSMYPLIENGQELIQLNGYYNCNEIKREDIVTYNFSANSNLLLKQVKAIPNDKFEYINETIYINGIELKNSQNITYNINSKIIELYAKDYPVIPENTYLILGENIIGTLDSSRFGLVSKKDIVGKVIIEKK